LTASKRKQSSGLAAPPDNQIQADRIARKLMLYDKDLSVNRTRLAPLPHAEAGFTGPVSELNRTTGAYPGSVRTRFSDRKPNRTPTRRCRPCCITSRQGDLVGGNFWDMRATGRPARQSRPPSRAQGPPDQSGGNGTADIACAVYRASQRPYRARLRAYGTARVLRSHGRRRRADLQPTGAGDRGRSAAGPSEPIDRAASARPSIRWRKSIAGYEASAE